MAMSEAADGVVPYEPGNRPDLPPPASERGIVGWLRHNLFSSWLNSILTLLGIALVVWVVPPVLNWLIFNATWTPPAEVRNLSRSANLQDCAPNGACWLFVQARFGQFVYGFYPAASRWRPDVVFVILCASIYWLLAGWTPQKKRVAIFFFLIFPFLAFWLLYGGLGLDVIPTQNWGGFMMTLIIGVVGIIVSLPLGVLLALGRRSNLPVLHMLSVGFIEFVRGVPLITVLFMANVMLPLFLPPGVEFDILLRVLIGVILFSAAYVAEVVRGGLQAIPKGQFEGAMAMGLGYWQMMRLIILPQALRISIPALVNSFIGLFMDTTLVSMVGLYDFLNMVKTGFKDANWIGADMTGYIFCAIVYWVCCFGMSRYSMHLERKLHTGHKKR
ncbi:MAG TPA: amino acid ABC transporter permease [Dongiaceae bacterium]|jgi:general L-amino acid transport system permease protein|nr:amino acid ABC transporter permease [Dongiaceae bacterium]